MFMDEFSKNEKRQKCNNHKAGKIPDHITQENSPFLIFFIPLMIVTTDRIKASILDPNPILKPGLSLFRLALSNT